MLLGRLLPDDPLNGRIAVVLPPWEPGKHGPRARYSDQQAAKLLNQAWGADKPESFRAMDESTQRRAIGVMRARSVPYAQLAKLTGLSSTTLKRLHVAGLAVT